MLPLDGCLEMIWRYGFLRCLSLAPAETRENQIVRIDLTPVFGREHRIAVTGIAGGGKTVFLTSLISHLIEHDPWHFVFGDEAKVTDFRELRVKGGVGQPFRLEAFRDSLSRRRVWPAKSVDCAHYRCEFVRSDFHYRRERLHFFDLPGERVADACVAVHEAFAGWSDHLLGHFKDHSEYGDLAADFLRLQQAETVVAGDLVACYRRLLARLILNFKPLISPSTFLLDERGQPAVAADADALANSRCSGLENGEFAPMSGALRRRCPEVARQFAVAYRAYRRSVALPVFDELRNCTHLVVLVDIPSLLLGGDGRYNDNRKTLLDLFEVLRPDSLIGARLLSLFGIRSCSLRKVAFVAAKADTVRAADVENGRLLGLLRSMTDRARHVLPGVDCDWFASSACVSTRSGNSPGTLIGLTPHTGADSEVEFEVSELPESWPRSWAPGQFHFTRVLPRAPANLQVPPTQMGVDRVMDFLLR